MNIFFTLALLILAQFNFLLSAGEKKIESTYRKYEAIQHIEKYVTGKIYELESIHAKQQENGRDYDDYEKNFYDGFFNNHSSKSESEECQSIYEKFIKPKIPSLGINKFVVMSPITKKTMLEKGSTPVLKRVNKNGLKHYYFNTTLIDTLKAVTAYLERRKKIYQDKLLFPALRAEDIAFFLHQVDEKIFKLMRIDEYDLCKKDKENSSLQNRINQLKIIKNKMIRHNPLTSELMSTFDDLGSDNICYLKELADLSNNNINFVFVEDMLRQLNAGTLLHPPLHTVAETQKLIDHINKKVQQAYLTQQQEGMHPVAALTNTLHDLKELFSYQPHQPAEQA
ncbi:MAG: hypothetical protein ACOYT8_06445 [Candidatus Dependentiae bacterium]